MGGAPAGYDAAAYGRDFKVFRAFVKQAAPDMLVLGPGSVGETAGDGGVAYGIPGVLNTADLLAASVPAWMVLLPPLRRKFDPLRRRGTANADHGGRGIV